MFSQIHHGFTKAIRAIRFVAFAVALVFMLAVILYMWTVSALLSGIARYSAPIYGLVGTLAAVPLLPALEQFGARLRNRTRRVSDGGGRTEW